MTPQTRSWLRSILGLLPLLAFVAWVAFAVDLRALSKALASAHVTTLILVMPALVYSVWAVRGLRWLIVLDAFGSRPAITPTFLMVGMSLGLAAVTPAQLGEFLKVGHARNLSGVPIPTAAGGYAVERVFDLLAVLGLATFSTNEILPQSKNAIMLLVLLSTLTTIAVVVILAAARFGRPSVVADSARAFLLLARRPTTLLLIAIMTFVSWLITGKLWQSAMAAVDVDVGYRTTLGIVGLTTLVSVASIVPAAVGVAEISVAALLGFLNHDAAAAAAAAVSLRVITVIGVAGGTACWLGLKATSNR